MHCPQVFQSFLGEHDFFLDITLDSSKMKVMDNQPDKYRRQLTEAWGELQLFERIQRKIENRVDDLRALIRATANLLTDDERKHELLMLDFFKHPTNVTEAVRSALYLARVKGNRLTPLQIR